MTKEKLLSFYFRKFCSHGLFHVLNICFIFSFSVLSGLCSNDCPDGVKVTDPFSLFHCTMSFTCLCMYVLALLVFNPCIFLKNIFSAFLAGRKEEAGIYPLMAKFIASRQNQLFIQEIREGDLNK